MRKIFSLFVLCLLVFSCDDGDVIQVELAFDKSLVLCGDTNSENYILYDTKNDPNESLTLLFPVSTANNLIFNPSENDHYKELTINGSSIKFNHRTYDGTPEALICQELPNPGVSITNDYKAASGALAKFTTVFVDDDNDGIPSVDENQDPNGDGDFSDAQDSDLDGIPDYIDKDDDNDNVPTINEDENLDGDNNPYTNPLNTDGDALPNYLDNNDDGDAYLTKDEDENGDKVLTNDFDESSDTPEVPRYLDNTSTEEFIQDELTANTYTRTTTVTVTIENAALELLNSDVIEFGTYEHTKTLPEN